jgi:2-polyprenyl-3-methyl-5-hydroxy-6-metoxy-1,4-benzoquinol methylase
VQLHEAGKRIVEVPIPTYYGDEICHVNGLRYAKDVAADVTRYRLHKLGLGSGELAFASDEYELKLSPCASHGRLLSWIQERPAGIVLDVGCADGRFGSLLRDAGHRVVGVDRVKHVDVGDRLDTFIEADLNRGLPQEVGSGFDLIVAADVLEHAVDPARLLEELGTRLAPEGVVFVSVPNFAHWYPRTRVALGRFDYDRRGILDAGHVRFFTRRSFERLVGNAGFEIVRRSVVGLPIEALERGGHRPSGIARLVGSIDRKAAEVWPTMFGYQFLYELRLS